MTVLSEAALLVSNGNKIRHASPTMKARQKRQKEEGLNASGRVYSKWTIGHFLLTSNINKALTLGPYYCR